MLVWGVNLKKGMGKHHVNHNPKANVESTYKVMQVEVRVQIEHHYGCICTGSCILSVLTNLFYLYYHF